MSWITKVFRKCRDFTFRPRAPPPKPRVSFTTSTLNVQRERILRHIASPIPFQNFLNEMRLAAMDEFGKDHMTLRDSLHMRKTAVRMWSQLSEEEKQKYRKLANNSLATRIPLHCLCERKSMMAMEDARMVESNKVEARERERLQRGKRTRSRTHPVSREATKRKTKSSPRRSKSKNPIKKKRKLSRVSFDHDHMPALDPNSQPLSEGFVMADESENLSPIQKDVRKLRKRRRLMASSSEMDWESNLESHTDIQQDVPPAEQPLFDQQMDVEHLDSTEAMAQDYRDSLQLMDPQPETPEVEQLQSKPTTFLAELEDPLQQPPAEPRRRRRSKKYAN